MLLYKRTRSTIQKWGDLVVQRIKRQLNVDRTVASGRTRDSIEGKMKATESEIKYEISSRSVPGESFSVLEAISSGRRPGKQPPYQAIMYWMEQKGVRARSKGGKFKKNTQSNLKSAAFGIAQAIGRKGTIKRFGYGGSDIIDFVVMPIQDKMTQDVADSFAQDLQDYIESGIKKPRLGRR